MLYAHVPHTLIFSTQLQQIIWNSDWLPGGNQGSISGRSQVFWLQQRPHWLWSWLRLLLKNSELYSLALRQPEHEADYLTAERLPSIPPVRLVSDMGCLVPVAAERRRCWVALWDGVGWTQGRYMCWAESREQRAVVCQEGGLVICHRYSSTAALVCHCWVGLDCWCGFG